MQPGQESLAKLQQDLAAKQFEINRLKVDSSPGNVYQLQAFLANKKKIFIYLSKLFLCSFATSGLVVRPYRISLSCTFVLIAERFPINFLHSATVANFTLPGSCV